MSPALKQQLPLLLTLSRIICAPLLMGMLFFPSPTMGWWATILFVLASLTDWADGALARRWNAESNAGKFLDPIADKILVLGAILMLMNMKLVDPIMVFLLIGRDVLIGGVRAIAATEGVVIAAKPFGKWKTAMQMVGIPLLLIQDVNIAQWPGQWVGYVLMWLSVVLSIISGVEYTWGYFKGRK